MEISLRSQLTAGIVFVGTAAIAVTPIVAPDVLPSVQRVTANVQNSAFVDPLSTLGQSLGLLGRWVFGAQSTAGVPLPLDPNDRLGTPWFLAPDGLLPQLIAGTEMYNFDPADPANPFTAIGGVTGTPLLSQIGINLSNYASAGVGALQGITDATGALLFGLPLAAFDVITALVNGETPDFATIIQDTIITPITNAFNAVIQAGTYIVTSVTNNALTVLSSLPNLAIAAAQTAVSGLVYTGGQLLNAVTTAIGDLTTLDFEGAWNTTVEGLLGPTGLIGNLLNLSIGQGVGELDNPDNPFIPSMRQTLTGATVAGSLSIQTPSPPVAAAPEAAAGGAGGDGDDAAGLVGNARAALSGAAAATGDSPADTVPVTESEPAADTGNDSSASTGLDAASITADTGSSETDSAPPRLQHRLAGPAASDPAPGDSGAAADSTPATATDAVDNNEGSRR